jgi:hypothetical protein
LAGLSHRKRVDDVVKRASHVVESIAKQQSPPPHIGPSIEAKAEQVHAAASVALSHNPKWITVAPAVGLAIERAQVLVCPASLAR